MDTEKKAALDKLRKAKELYVLMSDCTRMPYVSCDSETYDDEVFLYYTEEDAKKEAKKLISEKNPVRILKVENRFFLPFYTSLFPMGVNCLKVGRGTKSQTSVQLSELVRRPEPSEKIPKENVVENPELLLTAIYLMQQVRGKGMNVPNPEIRELEEEMMAHYREGKFLVAMNPEKKMPVLKKDDGQVLQPVFTDMQEFMKFQNVNKKEKYPVGTVEAANVPKLLSKETTAIVLNPFGINMQLNVTRKA